VSLRFDQPEMLLLALLGIPLALIAWRSLHMRTVRKTTIIVARFAVLLVISMMLAGASVERQTERMTVIALVDVSGSVRDFARTPEVPVEGYGRSTTDYLRWWFREASQDRRPDDRFGMIAFDGSTFTVAVPTTGDYPDSQLDVRLVDGTNMEQALRLARALFPPDTANRLVLAGDGNETTGNFLAALRETTGGELTLAGDGATPRTIPVDVLPLSYRVDQEVVVEAVDVPPSAPAGSAITMRVTLLATNATRGMLQVSADGEMLDLNGGRSGTGKPVQLEPGKNIELVTIPLSDRVIHRFEAYFQPLADSADRLVGNNRGEAVTVSPGEGRVLIVDNQDEPTGELLERTLRRMNVEVERVLSTQLPYDLLSYQAYDLVLLNNVPAEQVLPPLQKLLTEYVANLGGGLVMIGGADSFGAGGWNDTPLEEILPVKLDLPEQLVIPSAAVAFVLDSSGSMSRSVFGTNQSQQQVANEGAALAIQTLDRQDLVTVIAFDNRPHEVVPLSRNDDPQATMNLVRSIAPGGGTNLYPALQEAYQSLRDAEAQIKHVIVLSDGRSMPGPFIDLARRMYDEDITVSAIAVGDEADDAALSAVADAGGGQFYRVYQPQTLPRVFVREVRIVRKPLVREGRFDPVILPSGSPITMNLSQAPPLGGLVLTQPREEEKITLAAVDPEGLPVLAHWNVELGRVAAFTSGAATDWAEAWLRSPAYAELWGAIARVIARPAASQNSELTTQFEGNTLRIRLDAANREGDPLDLLTVPGSLYTPAGERVDISLEQTGPGTYEAVAPAAEAGNYVIALAPRKGSTPLPPVVAGAGRSTGPEYASLEANLPLLQRTAELSGGRLLDIERPEEAELYAEALRQPVEARQPIWLTLAWWCLPLLLLDVATRRIAWDRYVSKAAAVEFARQAADSVRSRGEEAATTLGTLRTRSRPEQEQKGEEAGPAKLTGDGGKMKPVRLRREELGHTRAARPTEQDVQAAMEGMGLKPGQRKSAPTSEAPADQREQAEEESPQTTSGLLAAKKRALDRLRQADDSDSEEG
jgi:uncharacterized membrane protein